MSKHSEEGFVPLRDGGRLAYRIDGASHGGAPILLVRPLGGKMQLWGTFRDRLAEHHRVIAYDYRAAEAGASRRTTKGLAFEAAELLEYLAVPRALVFGLSLGGMVATWLALVAPNRVAKLCIASAPLRGLDLSHTGLRRELSLAACFLRPEGAVEAALVRRILSRRFRQKNRAEVARIESVVRADPAGRASLLERAFAGMTHDARGGVGFITCPTLVLRGADDSLLGGRDVRDFTTALPRATLETFTGVGHDLTLEAPDLTARSVLRFFDGR